MYGIKSRISAANGKVSEFQMRKQPTTHMEEIGRVCSLKLASMTPFSE